MTQRILYVGNLREGGNGRDREAMFVSAGFEVIRADRYHYMMMGNRIERSLAARYHVGRGPAQFDQLLNRLAMEATYDLVFVDKGVWVRPGTLQRLRKNARRGLAIHYTPDAQFLENRSRFFEACLPTYDLAVTTKPFEVAAYTSAGARDVKLIHQGHGARLVPVPPEEIPDDLKSDVCFVGHCQPHYADVLQGLSAHVSLKIWGPNWTKYAAQNAWAKGVVQGDACFGADYAQVLSGAKIAIGLLSKRIPETTTTRSFEIPACGTMLLAERTDDHQALFAEGIEAEFFGDTAECVEKAVSFLADDAARQQIAAAGLARSQRSGYATKEQFQSVLTWIGADDGS